MTERDLVAALRPVVEALEALGVRYYIGGSLASSAHGVARASLDVDLVAELEAVKVDVFVSKGRPFDRHAAERARPQPIGDSVDAPVLPVASPEDTVLAKLEGLRFGGEVSERQGQDVIGVLRVAGDADHAYLRRWAESLGVADLLERAIEQARSET